MTKHYCDFCGKEIKENDCHLSITHTQVYGKSNTNGQFFRDQITMENPILFCEDCGRKMLKQRTYETVGGFYPPLLSDEELERRGLK